MNAIATLSAKILQSPKSPRAKPFALNALTAKTAIKTAAAKTNATTARSFDDGSLRGWGYEVRGARVFFSYDKKRIKRSTYAIL